MRTLLHFIFLVLTVGLSWSQQPAVAPKSPALPAPLAAEVGEYTTKRTEGLTRLTQMARTQVEAARQEQMKAGNLDAANATTQALASLSTSSPEQSVVPPANTPVPVVSILKDHATKVAAGIVGLNRLFIPRFEKVKVELLKAGDLAGANAADAKVKALQAEFEKLSPPKAPPATSGDKSEAPATSFTVEALIDGSSELHVTREGILWMVVGAAAKPGLHGGGNEGTYVNGTRWKPKWALKGDRGPDSSDVFPLKTTAPRLVSETLQVTKERFGKPLNGVTPVVTKVKDDHFVVTIPDPEMGSRWYKLRITAVP